MEVIVSLGLLVFGLAVVGLQVHTGLDMARTAEQQTRAVMLADMALASLDAGKIVVETYDEEVMGDFGRSLGLDILAYPGFAWRVRVEEAEVDNLYMVTMEIWFSARAKEDQIDDPEYEIDPEDEGMKKIREVYRLMAAPADIDLGRDFGVSEDQLEELEAQLGDQLPIPIDLTSIDPRFLAGLDDEALAELMPLVEEFLSGGGAGGGIEQLQDMAGEYGAALEGLLNGSQGGDKPGRPAGRGGRGGRRRGGERGGDRSSDGERSGDKPATDDAGSEEGDGGGRRRSGDRRSGGGRER